MKKILGLDLGTTSIGWGFVKEAENDTEKSEIIKLGVRVIPLTTDEEGDFLKGKATSVNADRTLKRGARRNLDRYQQRRDALVEILKSSGFIKDGCVLAEEGKGSTFTTHRLRANAARDKISKEEFAKVLLMINKKRGYKSSRKAKSEDEGTAIEGMDVAKILYDKDITPGQYVFELLKSGKKHVPDFYRSDLQNEFDKVWGTQKKYYLEILSKKLKDDLLDKNKTQTWAICKDPFNIVGIKLNGKINEQRIEKYRLRVAALSEKIDLELLAIVLQEINNQKNQSSGYLGAISDRSKELYFTKQTVGEYQFNQLEENPHARLRNQVFYRQDYLDEFETIWEIQQKHHPELTTELKKEIRDIIIFYQRRLKSQKHLIAHCEFEKHHKTIPKSSPLFQEFKIWQILHNLEYRNVLTKEKFCLTQEEKEQLFNELNINDSLSNLQILDILFENPKDFQLNFKNIEGNRTNASLYKAYQQILELEGEKYDFANMAAADINDPVSTKFLEIGITTDILSFNCELDGNLFDKQAIMQLWHLLYSYEGDNSRSGDESLIAKLKSDFGFSKEYAKIIAKVEFQTDYGSLSSRAIRKILPYMKAGHPYARKESDSQSEGACELAGYNHSSSFTKLENENRELKDRLDLLPKNSLRNPIVEKILNQLVNVVNAIIADESLGKPDEIRVELARELKKSANEREEMTKGINKANLNHERIRNILKDIHPFNNGVRISKNDIIKYKLYEELAPLGYKTLYTNTYIPLEKLFTKEFDIEHIIPQATLFDDSFSNKTLATRDFNSREKSNKTGIDAIVEKYGEGTKEYQRYVNNIEKLFDKGKGIISKAKYNKLLMKGTDLPDGFIERDLRNSQYIAKKAKQMLLEVVRVVNTTTGSITDRLREDWQLINVMQELNWDKYNALGLTYYEKSKDGKDIPKIKDWTKRNDHRHHAMDALTVAFTSYSHVQYLNNMSARKDESHKKYHTVYGIEQKYLYRDENGKLLFKPPIPLTEFRAEAKKHIESILISFKAKNKVVTRNKNKIKVAGKENFKERIELTPRGQLHKETVYGKIKQPVITDEKVGTKFDLEKINHVVKKVYREALLSRLIQNEGNPKKAFGGKNSPTKNPIFIDQDKTIELPERVEVQYMEDCYTIRKDITPDLKIDKIIDNGIKKILKARLNEFGNNTKEAFSNLDENPIWLNKEKGISIKRVTITGVSNAEPLHYKKNNKGERVLDFEGNPLPVDFVSTGNNHHVAIYKDENGNIEDEVVSFYEAVERVRQSLPIIDKVKNENRNWKFLFSMKQNEYFVFPSHNFDPLEIDLQDINNSKLISPNLYRVQKFSKLKYGNSFIREYVFRHHLETNVENNKVLKGVSYKQIQKTATLEKLVKVRINHLGRIVKVGEY
ncbi:MAG: type II CRISPR RNA-guided endonuclease Cas9 [Bacteroidales bacterium]|nr:type II CRISPR RNA-guided endonuclease Cas9 [Bacteroidales bacterium]MCF8455438.1 type II CRISPR RNA-guided endonuclease Cas9 [Bacteroidales bacterium]